MRGSYNPGEIYEAEFNNGQTREVLLIGCYDDYATVLVLGAYEPNDNALQIRSRAMMWADAGKLGYVFYDRMLDMIRVLNESEFNGVRTFIGKILNIPLIDSFEKEDKPLPVKPATERDATQDGAEMESLKAQYEKNQAEIQSVAAERDVYKDLYEKLLDKVLNR